MTAPELAPCPWCQRDTLIIDERAHTVLRETYAVRCKSNTCWFECEPFLNEKDAVALFRRAAALPAGPVLQPLPETMPDDLFEQFMFSDKMSGHRLEDFYDQLRARVGAPSREAMVAALKAARPYVYSRKGDDGVTETLAQIDAAIKAAQG